MPGAVELAQEIFRSAARVGRPVNLGGVAHEYQSPEYATAIGLLLYGANQAQTEGRDPRVRERSPGVVEGLKKWLRNFFE
jgi:cell division protein FtsA